MSTRTQSPEPAPTLLARSRAGAIFLAVIAPLGPLCFAISHLISPFGHDEFPVMYADIAADPVAAQVEMLFLTVGAVLGAVGALVVGAAVRGGSPRFGAVAAAVAFVGFALRAAATQSAAIVAAAEADVPVEQAATISEGISGQLQNAVLAPLSVCLFAGVLLLGIAGFIAARRRRFPFWLAILLTVSIVITFTMGSLMLAGIVPFKALSVAWLLVTVAFAGAGAMYVRQFRDARTA